VTLGTAWTQLLWHSLLLRDHVWHGRDLRGKLAAIRSKTDDGEAVDWGVATSPFITGPSAVRSLTVDIDEQLDWLVGEDPDYLLTLATNLRELAQRSLELGLRLPRLKQARSFGEMLQPDARNVVRRAWGVVIADSYSSEELGYIALQCPRHEQHYHLQSESLIVEVLDAGGRPCRPGEVGQVTVSTLHNFAMPLLRYASGDYAEVGEPCSCGRGLPVLTRIAGRQRNMLRRPDGVRHWPSFPISAWADAAPVRQIQLVQDAIDHVEARVVMPRDFAGDERALLEQALIRTLGYPFRMTVTRVDSIPRGAGQKYEDFVSLVD
jgi:phenylacetate-CoA ligase